MERARAVLPPIESILRPTQRAFGAHVYASSPIDGYSVEDNDPLRIRLWIQWEWDQGQVRVFTAETPDHVHVLVVHTPPEIQLGRAGCWEADPVDLVAVLDAPIGPRRVIDVSDGRSLKPVSARIVARREELRVHELGTTGTNGYRWHQLRQRHLDRVAAA